jgi:hypothetical protein
MTMRNVQGQRGVEEVEEEDRKLQVMRWAV